jgi:hypothetical protein
MKIKEIININSIYRSNLRKKRLIFLTHVIVFTISQNDPKFITLVSCVISQKYTQEKLCISFQKQTKQFNHYSNV